MALALILLATVALLRPVTPVPVEEPSAPARATLPALSVERGQWAAEWRPTGGPDEQVNYPAACCGVVHFLGHGTFDAASRQGMLLPEGAGGQSESLTARQWARLLHDEGDIRLAFLDACETALAPETAPFASVAGALVQAGMPAAVATQYATSDGAAASFAREFYHALADFYPLEAAVAEGRRAIDLLPKENYEWGVPVLYLRAQHGRLFR